MNFWISMPSTPTANIESTKANNAIIIFLTGFVIFFSIDVIFTHTITLYVVRFLFFTAKKDSDFLYVYRLNTAQDTADFYGMFENGSTEYDRLYQFQDDSRLGNVVICATETAFTDSGIIITEEDQKQ